MLKQTQGPWLKFELCTFSTDKHYATCTFQERINILNKKCLNVGLKMKRNKSHVPLEYSGKEIMEELEEVQEDIFLVQMITLKGILEADLVGN